MRTKMVDGPGHCEHIVTRDDGAKMTVWFVGRCWRYAVHTPGVGGMCVDVPGRESDETVVVTNLRRQFARGDI